MRAPNPTGPFCEPSTPLLPDYVAIYQSLDCFCDRNLAEWLIAMRSAGCPLLSGYARLNRWLRDHVATGTELDQWRGDRAGGSSLLQVNEIAQLARSEGVTRGADQVCDEERVNFGASAHSATSPCPPLTRRRRPSATASWPGNQCFGVAQAPTGTRICAPVAGRQSGGTMVV